MGAKHVKKKIYVSLMLLTSKMSFILQGLVQLSSLEKEFILVKAQQIVFRSESDSSSIRPQSVLQSSYRITKVRKKNFIFREVRRLVRS